jgi:phosphotriesterase-related protein
MTQVQTVLGPVDPADLGRVLPHEHLLALEPGPFAGDADVTDEDRVDRAVRALRGLPERGYGTVVDVSPYGVVGRDDDGANVVLLAEIARRSGMHVVSGTGLYLDTWTPGWAERASEDEVAARLRADVASGIGATGIRAGVLGEQATSLGAMTEREERHLRAAARVAAETGLTLFTHTTHGTLAFDQIRMLQDAGVDLGRVVVGHIDTQLSASYALDVLATGVSVAVDTIGKQEWDFFLGPPPVRDEPGEFVKNAFWRPDEGRADLVAEIVRAGYGDRVVLSMDVTGAETWMNADTHGRYGYTYLHDRFAPMLFERGVTAEQYDAMSIATPARLLAVG